MIEVDYLVIGAGAMGMAFTDVLLTETDATVAIVDRRGRPGGHWNSAYPFVRLHQPSAFYGVNSRQLGSDQVDRVGWNQGLYELASGSEVVAYFDQVMNQQFLPSGRVQYFPMCEYRGDGRFESLVSGQEHDVTVRNKTVDATYMHVTVPSMRPPAYGVADGALCEPLNGLTGLEHQPSGFVVVGAGKTGIDACLWLLANGVDPDSIRWIMPRDSWYLDRALVQPGDEFFTDSAGWFAAQVEESAAADSIDDLFDRLESRGALLRLDTAVRPTMYRCATITKAELDQLRRIENVVRLGRVQRIEADRIVLDDGEIPTDADTVHVDCSADGLERRPAIPMFDGDHITVQTVRACQQVFSAAFVAHVEAAYDDEQIKNELCGVVPHPDSDIDWLRVQLGNSLNRARWNADAELSAWLEAARLDGFSGPLPEGGLDDEQNRIVTSLLVNSEASVSNLQRLLAEIDDA